ncbi:hypothetical protein BU14_0098s0040 [Porphyra umbilicalis]|uniref:Malectin domain-containing protein n=1 Tax=Porphyra umbilicalis TaxID=2786 RepID=A0A1X6PDA5_PORUM|nr:hypothetical protein BU14_0098s0040 [Porphyra umbilicalis]|eukprot:OSX78814.1 hypothetical protein BU14_0098s0040 [Porphyra umbilicalis]
MARGSTAHRLCTALAVAAAAATAVAGQSALPGNIRYVNCGSDLIKSYEGHTWAADTGFEGGLQWVRTQLEGTGLPSLFHTARYRAGSLRYTLEVPASSTYRLELVFAETFFTEAARRFMDVFVTVDGEQTEAAALGLDVYGVAGTSPYKVVYPPLNSTTYGMPVTSTVVVTLQSSVPGGVVPVGNADPFLSGFGVYEDAAPTPTPAPTPGAEAPLPTPDVSTISAAFAATQAAGAPTLFLRTDAAAVVANASAVTAELAVLVAQVDTVRGVTPSSPDVEAAYAAASNAFAAADAAAAAVAATHDASHGPLTAAYTDAMAFINTLSPEVCSYITGFVRPFQFADEAMLAVKVEAVQTAAAAASAAAPTLAEKSAALQAAAAAAREAADAFLAEVRGDAQPTPVPVI